MSPIALPPDRRFRRAHVKPARMRRHWQTAAVRMAGYGLFIAVLLYAARRVPPILAQASLLQVDRIVVHGNERLSTDEVLTLLNGLRGQSLIATDLETWRLQMLSSPWVRTAELRRSLPSTVDVFLSEKEPLGIARVRGRMYLLDDGGGFIDEYGPHYAHFDLPIIDGLEAPSARADAVNTPRVELVAQLLAALSPRPDIARRVSQIDVRDLHNVAVILTGDPAVVLLGDQQFLERLQSYLEVASDLRERVADIDHVDVRFDGRIYVKPTGKGSKAERALGKRKR